MNAMFDLLPMHGTYELGRYQIYVDPDDLTIGDLFEIIEENNITTPQELADYARANLLDIQVYEVECIRL